MQIIQKKLADIVPYANNAKKHDETQIKNVAESIKKYGWVQPIVIDDDGTIVIGHCRALAAEKLGIEEVPCVVVSDLTEEEINALRIVDNKTNESPWDMDLLSAELPEIDLSDFEFDFEFEFGGEDYSPDDFGEEFSLADGDKSEICQMTFTLHARQKELIEHAIQQVKENVSETFGNTNANGNGLYEVVRQWAERKK